MIKAKSIRSIKDNIIKYKKLLDHAVDPLERLKLEIKLKEQQWHLSDVEYQLTNIDIYLRKDSELYKSLFIDRYVYGLTQNQLINKYNMASTTLYKKLAIAREVFEGKSIYRNIGVFIIHIYKNDIVHFSYCNKSI